MNDWMKPGGAALLGGARTLGNQAANRNLRMVLRAARRIGLAQQTHVKLYGAKGTLFPGVLARVDAGIGLDGHNGRPWIDGAVAVGRSERKMFSQLVAGTGDGRAVGRHTTGRTVAFDAQQRMPPGEGLALATADAVEAGGALESRAVRRLGQAEMPSVGPVPAMKVLPKRHFLLRRPPAVMEPAQTVAREEVAASGLVAGAVGTGLPAVRDKVGGAPVARDGHARTDVVAGAATLRWAEAPAGARTETHIAAGRSPLLAYAGQKAAAISRGVAPGTGAISAAPLRSVDASAPVGSSAGDGGGTGQAACRQTFDQSTDMGTQANGPRNMAGDVYLDGQLVGRWMEKHLAQQAGRPPTGSPAFDPTRSPYPPGRMIGT